MRHPGICRALHLWVLGEKQTRYLVFGLLYRKPWHRGKPACHGFCAARGAEKHDHSAPPTWCNTTTTHEHNTRIRGTQSFRMRRVNVERSCVVTPNTWSVVPRKTEQEEHPMTVTAGAMHFAPASCAIWILFP